jgi:hypothetical protein
MQQQSRKLCNRIAREAWCEIVVVTHWSFIKAVAGLDVPNVRRCKSTRPSPTVRRNRFIYRIRAESWE